MKFVKMKISVLLKKWVSVSLTQIMTCRIGLREAKGMEYELERGKRCSMCFDMRFERTALYAYEMILKLLPVLLVFPVGKIWIKLVNQGSRLLLITME